MNDRLKQLYKSHILTKAKDETHFGELSTYTHVLEAYNPMCGDKYSLYLEVEDERIKNASFKGFGCSISKASTAVLAARLVGAKFSGAKELTELFMELINSDSLIPVEELTDDEELLAFAGTRNYPERKQCASLVWDEFIKSGPLT